MNERPPTRVSPTTYVRIASLGDSFSCAASGSPAWDRILSSALAHEYDVSLCELAQAGATTAEIRLAQVPAAQAHRPQLAALTGGLNDAHRGIWDADAVRYRLMRSADDLSWSGVSLMTVRFLAAGPHARRISDLNEIYDEIDDAYGSLRLDLGEVPCAALPEFWSIPAVQPSARGHRHIAAAFLQVLACEPVFVNRRRLAHAG